MKTSIWRSVLSVVVLSAIIFGACEHEPFNASDFPNAPQNQDTTGNNNPGDTTTPADPCHPDTVYYARDIQPLLNSFCAYSGCHDANTASNDVILNNYQNVMQTGDVRPNRPDNSDLYEVLVETDPDKRMPYNQPPLEQSKINLIRKWINQGAQNLSCDECDTTSVSYNTHIQNIVDASCINCHSSSSDVGGRDLSSYSALRDAVENTNLLARINGELGANVMPQGGKMDECKIEQIEIWAREGFPQ